MKGGSNMYVPLGIKTDYSLLKSLNIPSLNWNIKFNYSPEEKNKWIDRIPYLKNFIDSDFNGDNAMAELIINKLVQKKETLIMKQQTIQTQYQSNVEKCNQYKTNLYEKIMPTIMTMLILRIGNILNVGFEKILLLYNPSIYDTADVISTYVYRVGLQEYRWGYSTAVGLFNSVINFIFLILANYMSKRFNDVSLW